MIKPFVKSIVDNILGHEQEHFTATIGISSPTKMIHRSRLIYDHSIFYVNQNIKLPLIQLTLGFE